ncbi:hypothetical protein JKP88DRAFT_250011 [Tribonema minus]|uniref:CCHC-type domain-containing protein n=1 Tax=Tribonema minus TaxID=303371 RepID=A0A836C8H7_9STRA|nr:hypothetical protein JKP88DRAFT_250011 [Tribonema minus]
MADMNSNGAVPAGTDESVERSEATAAYPHAAAAIENLTASLQQLTLRMLAAEEALAALTAQRLADGQPVDEDVLHEDEQQAQAVEQAQIIDPPAVNAVADGQPVDEDVLHEQAQAIEQAQILDPPAVDAEELAAPAVIVAAEDVPIIATDDDESSDDDRAVCRSTFYQRYDGALVVGPGWSGPGLRHYTTHGGRTNDTATESAPGECFTCRKFGHWRRDCPY